MCDSDAHQHAIIDLLYVGFFLLCQLVKYYKGGKTHVWSPSGLATFIFLLYPIVFAPPTQPYIPSTAPTLFHLLSTIIKTWYAGSQFSTASLDTTTHAPSTASSPAWITPTNMTLAPKHPCDQSKWDTTGATPLDIPSRRNSDLPAPTWGNKWASSLKKFPHNPSERGAPWSYSSVTSTWKPSALSRGDAGMKLCSTSTSWCTPSCRNMPRPWFLQGIAPFLQQKLFSRYLSQKQFGGGGLQGRYTVGRLSWD